MKKLLFNLFVLSSIHVWSQDVHFTMFQVAPSVSNPAASGVFQGTLRASANYRSQWASVTSNPYKTFSVNIDGTCFKNRRKNAYLGFGFNAYRDVAGTTNFGITKLSGIISGVVHITKEQSLSVGMKGGWGQYSISTSNLKWDAQYNGSGYDPSLPSNEIVDLRRYSNFDFSTGIMWTYGTTAQTLSSQNNITAELGIAYHHLLKPDLISFYTKDPLHGRYVLHGELLWSPAYSMVGIRPRVNIQVQGPASEYNLGLLFRYMRQDGSKYTGNIKGWALSLGAYYRVLDAISPTIEVEYGQFTFGMCYDVTISKLTRYNNARGGTEFFLRFQNPNPFSKFHRETKYRF